MSIGQAVDHIYLGNDRFYKIIDVAIRRVLPRKSVAFVRVSGHPPGPFSQTWDPSDLRVDIQDPMRYGIATELYDFADAVAAGRPPEIGAEEGTAAVAVCLAVLESAALNAPVAVADVTSGRVRTWQQDLDRELGLDS